MTIISTIAGTPCRKHRIVVGASGNRWGCQVCRSFSGVRDSHGVMPVSCHPTKEALERYRQNQRETIAEAEECLEWADMIEREDKL